MFKTSKEFEQAFYNVLSSIHRDPDDFDAWANIVPDIELNDVLQRAIDLGYLLGVTLNLGLDGNLSISNYLTRLSYDGMKFIETYSE